MKQNPFSMRAAEILRNKFGVSQLYSYDVTQDGAVLFKVFLHPLTIAERESIQKKVGSDDANDFALGLMIEKALDQDGKRLFQDGERAILKNSVDASILQEIQLAMLTSGSDNKVEDAKADLKS